MARSDRAVRRHSTARGGFTFVELLVVLAIIGVLLALTIGGTFSIIETQRQNNSENTMRTVQKVLDAHWKHVIDEAKKEEPSSTVMTLAYGDRQRARIIWIKLRLMEAFPMSFAEIINPPVYQKPSWASEPWIPASRTYKNIPTYFNKLKGRIVANTNPLAEPGACLFLALSQNRAGAKLDADTLANSVRDTDGDNMKEIVDSWSTALAYFPFPTGQAGEMNQFGTAGGSLDPLDPQGLLMNSVWQSQQLPPLPAPMQTRCGIAFSAMFHPLMAPRSAHIVPVIVSAGRNQRFGLNVAMAVMPGQENAADDNLYSFRLRLGARGD